MKRRRLAPTLFAAHSQSEDSPDEQPSHRRRLDPNKLLPHDIPTPEPSPSAPAPESIEQDSLDIFMNALNAPVPAPNPRRQLPARNGDSSESSSDRFHTEHSAETHHLHPPTADAPARDLILQPVDHIRMHYPAIASCGYVPLPRVADLTSEQRECKLRKIGASVMNDVCVTPIDTFHDLALVLPKPLLSAVLASFATPTPIQRLSIPAALFGKNVIGVAKTGSGKTAAYAIPLLAHVAAQPRGSSVCGRGPTALVVAPTRELASQISGVIRRFGDVMGIGVACVVGGHAKFEQFKRLRDGGAEVIVCTPGRFIDMIKMKACGLGRCSFVVLDEADRMFDMGFGGQVDALLSQIRPDSQKLLFSATFPRSVARLANMYVDNPIRITIGQAPESGDGSSGAKHVKGNTAKQDSAAFVPMVSENVKEIYVVLDGESEREAWLLAHLDQLISEGLVIIFCQTRGGAASLANMIRTAGRPAACVHGETDHADREGLLQMFRGGELSLLVTTDLSARGLDIANIRNVVNYGCAKSWEWHVHRVGRTGRASEKGRAFTLISKQSKGDKNFVSEASYAFRKSQRQVPQPLLELEALERNARRGFRPRGRGFRGRRRYK